MGRPTPDPLGVAKALSARLRAALVRLVGRTDRFALPEAVRREVARYEPALARTLRDGQVLGWLRAAGAVARTAPALPPDDPPSDPPDGWFPPPPPGDPDPPTVFPQVERAARYLATRLDYTTREFAELDAAAKGVAFAVAAAQTLDAVERVRAALVRSVADGDTPREFRAAVREVLDESALSDAQVETIHRTHVARAYSAGQQDVLDHPMVADEFPFVQYVATHDGRVEDTHLAMERLGLDGTAVYYADDPVIRRFWPPWRWRCRCFIIPLSVEDAAAAGVREAAEWARTGTPPVVRTSVKPPPFDLPKGWVPVARGLRAVV